MCIIIKGFIAMKAYNMNYFPFLTLCINVLLSYCDNSSNQTVIMNSCKLTFVSFFMQLQQNKKIIIYFVCLYVHCFCFKNS